MAVILGAQDSTGGAGGAVAGVDSEVENNAHNSNAPTPPIDSDIPPPAIGSSTMGPPPQVVTNENQILVARHSAENDWFGGSVAISEDVMEIGIWTVRIPLTFGGAYAYILANGVGMEQTKLTAIGVKAGDFFGIVVSVDGDTVVMGVDRDQGNDLISGSAYVFLSDL